jgi:hypothetical protein
MSAPPADVPVPRRCRAAVRQTWIDRLQRFAAAGQTPADFCAAEGVSLASFYLWKRRLAAEHGPPAGEAGMPRLLPVRLTAAATPVELVLPGGAVLRLGPGCDLDFVRALLAALGGTPC